MSFYGTGFEAINIDSPWTLDPALIVIWVIFPKSNCLFYDTLSMVI